MSAATWTYPRQTWKVSRFDGLFDVDPKPEEWGWLELVNEQIRAEYGESKGAYGLWCPGIWEAGDKRKADAVDAVSVFVLDIDHARADWLETWRLFDGLARVQHTTWSHTEEAPRLRVVLPLAEPIPGEVWRDVWLDVVASLPEAIQPDQACKDASRMFYLPVAPESGTLPDVWADPGKRCLSPDVSAILSRRDRREAQQARQRDRRIKRNRVIARNVDQEVRRRLREDPDARERWALELGMGIFGTGQDQRAEYTTCPSCDRRSVWWLLSPTRAFRARCHHDNSCGWSGWLEDLR